MFVLIIYVITSLQNFHSILQLCQLSETLFIQAVFWWITLFAYHYEASQFQLSQMLRYSCLCKRKYSHKIIAGTSFVDWKSFNNRQSCRVCQCLIKNWQLMEVACFLFCLHSNKTMDGKKWCRIYYHWVKRLYAYNKPFTVNKA